MSRIAREDGVVTDAERAHLAHLTVLLSRALPTRALAESRGTGSPSRRLSGRADLMASGAAEEPRQRSNTNQHSSLRNRWSSSTRSRTSRGS
jgi:hypothetical protein